MRHKEEQKLTEDDSNNPSLVFCHTVRTVLPLLPLGDLDFGVVGRSEPKVRVDDNFVHLQTKGRTGRNDKGRVRKTISRGKLHQLRPFTHPVSMKRLLVHKEADSPGWCTADQSHKAG